MKKEFFDFMKELDGKTYLEYHITYLISPVFTGVKPSSLIGLDNKHRQLLSNWHTYGDDYLKNHNLKSIILRHCQDKDLILIYNEQNLLKSISEPNNRVFLQKLGYINFENLDKILKHLYERYNNYHCPHEIGIFLGIPLQDVEAFMDCQGKNCLLCGYWKVFTNEEKAKELFRIYDWSKEMVMSHSLKGKDLSWITSFLKIPQFNV
jgi:hypothetical protein